MCSFATLTLMSCICTSMFFISDAGYTSVDSRENTKAMYSAVSSILGTAEHNRERHTQTYDSPPNPGNFNPYASATAPAAEDLDLGPSSPGSNYPDGNARPACPSAGCPLPNSPNGLNKPSDESRKNGAGNIDIRNGGIPTGNQNSPYPGSAPPTTGNTGAYPTSYQGYGQPYPGGPPTPNYGNMPYMPNPQYPTPQYGYTPPNYNAGYRPPYPYPSQPYAPMPNQPTPNYVQGYDGLYMKNRGRGGYSTVDHSLKTNTEYKETGHHTGPYQGPTPYNNYGGGYGGIYGGGYGGAFNRPMY